MLILVSYIATYRMTSSINASKFTRFTPSGTLLNH